MCALVSVQLRRGSASPEVQSSSHTPHTSELRKLELIQTGIFVHWLAKLAKQSTILALLRGTWQLAAPGVLVRYIKAQSILFLALFCIGITVI